jgi:nitroreductase
MSEPTSLDDLKAGTTGSPVEQLLLSRWSPRAFADTPVGDQNLQTLFIAAGWAASSYNEQPWRFLVGLAALMPLNQGWAHVAPVLIAACAKKTFTHNAAPNRVAAHDVGAASANLALQATALGLHAHGMAGFDPAALRTAFAIPEDFDPIACWALGTLGDPESLPDPLKEMELKPRQRKPLGEFVFSEWEKPAL